MMSSLRFKWVVLVFLTALVCAKGFAAQAKQNVLEAQEEMVKAYFTGYEENDIIFRIINSHGVPIIIKGLAFKSNILYRPVRKNISVPAVNDEHPFLDVAFRSTGDYVWSQNHMDRFQLAYELVDIPGRLYVQVLPKMEKAQK